jgi:hypothetical protein
MQSVRLENFAKEQEQQVQLQMNLDNVAITKQSRPAETLQLQPQALQMVVLSVEMEFFNQALSSAMQQQLQAEEMILQIVMHSAKQLLRFVLE